jgi:hypothetical protein
VQPFVLFVVKNVKSMLSSWTIAGHVLKLAVGAKKLVGL